MAPAVVLATVAEKVTTWPAVAELAGAATAVDTVGVVDVVYCTASFPEPDDGPKVEPPAGV